MFGKEHIREKVWEWDGYGNTKNGRLYWICDLKITGTGANLGLSSQRLFQLWLSSNYLLPSSLMAAFCYFASGFWAFVISSEIPLVLEWKWDLFHWNRLASYCSLELVAYFLDGILIL